VLIKLLTYKTKNIMGLFSFIKNAGAKVFGIGKTVEEEKAEAAAKANAQELKEEVLVARRLEGTISDLQLQVENLKIHIDDDMAKVSGLAYDQTTKEKVVLVIGNTEGISTVDDQMTVEHVEPEAQFHTVKSGDTLGKIAKHYYGNAMKYPIIFDANKPMLTDPDKIYPGQVLRIPHLD
jgi:nucleoid-associated protein YgaU